MSLNCRIEARGRGILLLHDIQPATALALPDILKELKTRGAAVVSVAGDSQLGKWLKQGRASAAIVRPDGAVMQAGRNVAAIFDAVPAFSAGHVDAPESER